MHKIIHLTLTALAFLFITDCQASREPAIHWKFKTGFAHAKISPSSISTDKIYVSSDKLYCLDTETGKLIWEFQPYGVMSRTVVVKNGYVYFQCGGLYCLDATTGRIIWEFWPGKWANNIPAVTAKRAYAIFDKQLYCLNAENGEKIWIAKTTKSFFPPAATNDHVYIGGKKQLLCLSVKNGKQLWRHRNDSANFFLCPIIIGENIIILSVGLENMYCLDGGTGRHLWNHPTPLKMTTFDKYIFSSNDYISCLDAFTGKTVWEKKYDSQPFLETSPNNLYLRIARKLTLIDPLTGDKKKTIKIPKGTPVIADKFIFTSDKHSIYCIKKNVSTIR